MPEPIVATVDAKGMPLPPVDPNVPIPANVKAASAAADAIHQRAYQTQPQPQPTQVTAPVPPQPQPQPQAQPGDPRASWGSNEWMQHARSMEGRFKQASEQVMTLQGTVTTLGEELVATQSSRATLPQPPSLPIAPAPVPLITPQDVETYGEDFLNVAQRAALQAVQPKLTALEQQNNALRQQL